MRVGGVREGAEVNRCLYCRSAEAVVRITALKRLGRIGVEVKKCRRTARMSRSPLPPSHVHGGRGGWGVGVARWSVHGIMRC